MLRARIQKFGNFATVSQPGLPNGTQLSFATQLLIEMAVLAGISQPIILSAAGAGDDCFPVALSLSPAAKSPPAAPAVAIHIIYKLSVALSLHSTPRRFSTLMMFAEHWSSNLIIRRTYTVLVARFTCTGALKRRTQHSLDTATRASEEKNNSFRPRGPAHCLPPALSAFSFCIFANTYN